MEQLSSDSRKGGEAGVADDRMAPREFFGFAAGIAAALQRICERRDAEYRNAVGETFRADRDWDGAVCPMGEGTYRGKRRDCRNTEKAAPRRPSSHTRAFSSWGGTSEAGAEPPDPTRPRGARVHAKGDIKRPGRPLHYHQQSPQ